MKIRIISCVNVHLLLFNIITSLISVMKNIYVCMFLTHPVEFFTVYTVQCMSNIYIISIIYTYVYKSTTISMFKVQEEICYAKQLL